MSWLNYIKGQEGLAVVSEVLLNSRRSGHTTEVQRFPWRGSENSNSLSHIMDRSDVDGHAVLGRDHVSGAG